MSTETTSASGSDAVGLPVVEASTATAGTKGPALQDDAMRVITEAFATAQTPCITSSFQAECVVLTHMLLQVRPDIPVLFLDTFHHFPQTLAYRDELTAKWGL